MGHLPVITGVWRATFEFNQQNGVAPRNVMHFLDPTNALSASEFFTRLDDAFNDTECWGPVSSAFTCEKVALIKLDGNSATTFHATDSSGKWQGHVGGAWVPNQSAVVKFSTGIRGRSNRGRIFLGPVAEAAVTDGMLDSGFVDDLDSSWVAFTNALLTEGDGIPLVIASYRHANEHQVLTVAARSRVGSTVRRLNQIPLT